MPVSTTQSVQGVISPTALAREKPLRPSEISSGFSIKGRAISTFTATWDCNVVLPPEGKLRAKIDWQAQQRLPTNNFDRFNQAAKLAATMENSEQPQLYKTCWLSHQTSVYREMAPIMRHLAKTEVVDLAAFSAMRS